MSVTSTPRKSSFSVDFPNSYALPYNPPKIVLFAQFVWKQFTSMLIKQSSVIRQTFFFLFSVTDLKIFRASLSSNFCFSFLGIFSTLPRFRNQSITDVTVVQGIPIYVKYLAMVIQIDTEKQILHHCLILTSSSDTVYIDNK